MLPQPPNLFDPAKGGANAVRSKVEEIGGLEFLNRSHFPAEPLPDLVGSQWGSATFEMGLQLGLVILTNGAGNGGSKREQTPRLAPTENYKVVRV